MKLAIISSHSSKNTLDLVDAAKRLQVEVEVFALKELALAVDRIDTHPFFEFDAYLFRGYNKNYVYAEALARILQARGKLIIDSQVAVGTVPSKLYQALVYKEAGVAHIPTYTAADFNALQAAGFPNKYPVVVKDVDSQKGKGVRLANNEEELRTEITQHGHTILMQQFLEMPYDLRVLCVGDEVIGAIKRESSSEDFRTNVSLGGTASVYALSDEDTVLALKAKRAMGFDIAGVDIAHDAAGKPFVIETNITPEWQGFTSATGIDIGEKVITYVLEKYHAAL